MTPTWNEFKRSSTVLFATTVRPMRDCAHDALIFAVWTAFRYTNTVAAPLLPYLARPNLTCPVLRRLVHFQKWLEDHSQCPHCRSELSVHDLVRANFVEEVNQERGTLQKILIESDSHPQELEKFAKRGSGVAEELCQAHGSSLQYFCRTCSTSICAGENQESELVMGTEKVNFAAITHIESLHTLCPFDF